MPTRSSLGESSLPVSDRPALFQPTESQGTPPSWKIDRVARSPRFSIATIWSSIAGPRSLVWPTRRWPSAVAVRPGHDVAASALGHALTRLVPDLLHGHGEELERIDAGALGTPVELLDQPGEPLAR